MWLLQWRMNCQNLPSRIGLGATLAYGLTSWIVSETGEIIYQTPASNLREGFWEMILEIISLCLCSVKVGNLFHGPKVLNGLNPVKIRTVERWFQLVTPLSTLLLPCRCAFTFERIHPIWVIPRPAFASRHGVSHQEVHLFWLSFAGPSVGLDWWSCSAVDFGTYWKEVRLHFRTSPYDFPLMCFRAHRSRFVTSKPGQHFLNPGESTTIQLHRVASGGT